MAHERLYAAIEERFADQIRHYKDCVQLGVPVQEPDGRIMRDWIARMDNPVYATQDLVTDAQQSGHVGLKYGPTDAFCPVCMSNSRPVLLYGKKFSDWKEALDESAVAAMKDSASPIDFVFAMHQVYHNRIVEFLTDLPAKSSCSWRGQMLYCQPWTPTSIAEHYLFHSTNPSFLAMVKAQMRGVLCFTMVGGLINRADGTLTTADLNVLRTLAPEPMAAPDHRAIQFNRQ